ncbi:uncharacterized protein TNCT_386841 [Trichonephila clavata]|uniref:Uncharacterized protein n=1 Tax=Trichonephila clavata TaxID=2740835 RepID=A0A8X6FBB2_TRICU|nr:uncharacterized protein TNCT_386841 [Trichonephila clavata]
MNRNVWSSWTQPWFRYPLVPEWEARVMAALVECKIMDVYVAGLLLSLKRMAPEEMNVYVDPEPNKLKYPCKMCQKRVVPSPKPICCGDV